jgi:hypothetical protein
MARRARIGRDARRECSAYTGAVYACAAVGEVFVGAVSCPSIKLDHAHRSAAREINLEWTSSGLVLPKRLDQVPSILAPGSNEIQGGCTKLLHILAAVIEPVHVFLGDMEVERLDSCSPTACLLHSGDIQEISLSRRTCHSAEKVVKVVPASRAIRDETFQLLHIGGQCFDLVGVATCRALRPCRSTDFNEHLPCFILNLVVWVE